nr:uncharacterized protein LOC108176864 [Oryctolagus cuniculus]
MLHPGGQGGVRKRAPQDWPAPPQGSRGTSAADARLVQVRLGWTRQLPERVLRCPAPTPGSGVQRAPLPWAPLSAGPSAPLGRPPEARTLAPRSGWLLRGAGGHLVPAVPWRGPRPRWGGGHPRAHRGSFTRGRSPSPLRAVPSGRWTRQEAAGTPARALAAGLGFADESGSRARLASPPPRARAGGDLVLV